MIANELSLGGSVHPGQELIPGVYAWQKLGRGKWCESWIGWSMPHGYPVTVKFPQTSEVVEEARVVLCREARRLAMVRHPAFQRVLGGDLAGDAPFLVLDYIDGPTLGLTLEEDGPFNLVDALIISAEIAAAVGYLHRLGFAHLDLKPNNVVLRDGRVVLLDVGLATRLGGRLPAPRGTKGYVAPEHWHDAPVAPTSDVFSIGAVLFELIAAKPPFAEKTEPVALPDFTAILRRSPRTIPLLEQLLALDPRDRIDSADTVLRTIAELLPADDRGWPAMLHDTLDWTRASDAPRWMCGPIADLDPA